MNIALDVKGIEPSTPGAIAFLKSRDKKMLIGGDWVDAVSGKRIDSKDPATGAVIASIPAGAKADVDKAVTVARASFDKGVWRNKTPDERARVLWKISELIEANIDELAELETLDQGKPLFVGRWAEIPGAAAQFRYFSGQATKLEGTTIPTSINYQPLGKQVFAYTLKEPVGVVGAITQIGRAHV